MQKILITGANGFIGYYLTQQLLHKGYQVIATGKDEKRLQVQHANFTYRSMDFTDEQTVINVFDEVKPEVVIHCGAVSKPDDCEQNKETAFRINVTGTINLLKASEKNETFFIFLSTDFVFAGESLSYKEEDVRWPVNYYGQTKLLAEDEVMKYKYDWSIVRTVLVYGKPITGRQNILTMVAAALQQKNPIRIFQDQVRTPTYVEDLAAGIVSIVEKKATGIYHLSGEDKLSPYQMAVAVAKHLQLDEGMIENVTEKDFEQPARRPPVTGFDLTKAKKELGYTVVSFAEGLKKTFYND